VAHDRHQTGGSGGPGGIRQQPGPGDGDHSQEQVYHAGQHAAADGGRLHAVVVQRCINSFRFAPA